MYSYIREVLEVKSFNTKQVIVRGLTEKGKELYLYTTVMGEWKQTTKEVFIKLSKAVDGHKAGLV